MDTHEVARRASALPGLFAGRVPVETLEGLRLMEEGGGGVRRADGRARGDPRPGPRHRDASGAAGTARAAGRHGYANQPGRPA